MQKGTRLEVPTLLSICLIAVAHAAVTPYSVAPELQSNRFTVTANSVPVPVGRMVNMLFYANFDFTCPVEISVTSPNPRFWNQGVIISPMIRRIYQKVNNGTITFTLTSPGNFNIERPGNRVGRYSGGRGEPYVLQRASSAAAAGDGMSAMASRRSAGLAARAAIERAA